MSTHEVAIMLFSCVLELGEFGMSAASCSFQERYLTVQLSKPHGEDSTYYLREEADEPFVERVKLDGIRVLVIAHRNGISVWVVEFLMGSCA